MSTNWRDGRLLSDDAQYSCFWISGTGRPHHHLHFSTYDCKSSDTGTCHVCQKRRSTSFSTLKLLPISSFFVNGKIICMANKTRQCINSVFWHILNYLYIIRGLSRWPLGMAWMDGRSRAAARQAQAASGELRAKIDGSGGGVVNETCGYKQGWADEWAGRRASRRPKSRFWLVANNSLKFTLIPLLFPQWSLCYLFIHFNYNKQLSKVIWQKAASPTCYPSRLRTDVSDLDPNLIHGSLGQSAPQTTSRSVHPFLQGSQTWPTDTDHATLSVAIGLHLMYWVHAIRPRDWSEIGKFTGKNIMAPSSTRTAQSFFWITL